MKDLVIQEVIEQKIYLIRGQKVMLDFDLAVLYKVEIRSLNQAVKRNIKRFPEDFAFKLKKEEFNSLRSQIVTLTEKKYDIYLPYAFTEHGILMLSSVLNSERAIQVNIQIMRLFIKMREILKTHKELLKKIENMEKKYDRQFRIVFDIIRELNSPKENKNKRKIGFV